MLDQKETCTHTKNGDEAEPGPCSDAERRLLVAYKRMSVQDQQYLQRIAEALVQPNELN